MNLQQRDRKFLARSESSGLQITRSQGHFVEDARGRRYLDFTSGWCVGNLGWNVPEIRAAIRQFRGPAYVTPDMLYAPWAELAALLARLAPRGLTKSFRATGGTEAVELALQAALLRTGRREFLALEDSYHGHSLGALSVGASENRETVPRLLPGCHKVKGPLDARALGVIERRLRTRRIAAFILEPVPINLGVQVPAAACVARLQALCRRYGTLIIADEVACGFGRTGRLFACDLIGLRPDCLCLGKAITAGHAAMGAMMTTDEIAQPMTRDGNFYSTFGWHPLSTAVALATLRYYGREKERLMRHVAGVSEYFRARLLRMDLPQVKARRVQGLAIAIEFADDSLAGRLEQRCQERGLLITSSDESTLLLLPALTLPRALARRGLDILERSLALL